MTVLDHPERSKARVRGDLAERLVPVAAELAFMVRDEDREAIGAWLDHRGIAAGDTEARALLVVLAAMVPVDATPEQMLEWVTWDEYGRTLDGAEPAPAWLAAPVPQLEPCGTLAAYRRHKDRGEDAEGCGCAVAARAAWAEANRNRRQRKQAEERADAA